MDEDLKAAAIPKRTGEGKIDFHALRVCYVTLVVETGATIKEAQMFARHATPTLTMNTYARSRDERLADITEQIGDKIRRAKSTTDRRLSRKSLRPNGKNGGGGGSRTRVRRCIGANVYVRSP